MIKIYKPEARKRFRQGEHIYVLPCKMRVDNVWWKPAIISKDKYPDEPFDRIIREYGWYNCNKDTGYYAAYYVKEDK